MEIMRQKSICTTGMVLFAVLFTFFSLSGCDDNGKNPIGPLSMTGFSDPEPTDGRGNYPPDIELSWTFTDPDVDTLLTFDVYFGITQNPPLVDSAVFASYYDPGRLLENQEYFWKIIAFNNRIRAHESPVYSFKTGYRLGTTDAYTSMIRIEPGAYMMGASAGEQDAAGDEFPQHSVSIDSAFYIGMYEVTQIQWKKVMDGLPSVQWGEGDDIPVYYVSWDDVHDFLNRLNEMQGREIWRLPTEAEWEYACRAGTATRFPWGDDSGYEYLNDNSWHTGNSSGMAQRVGLKQPNPWSLYDMTGNICEWCEDYYHADYDGAPSNGSAWLMPATSLRVLRGGACRNNSPAEYRSASRFEDVPNGRNISYGFRIVRNP